jgi:nucleotide-binding universal stress UspA family protein
MDRDMHVLVPVRYPLTARNLTAIQRGLELLEAASNPELIVLHVDELLDDEHVDRADLRAAVEAEFDAIQASYVVRDGFLTEAAILDEAIRLDATHVVISRDRRNRWQRLTGRLFDSDVDLAAALRTRADIELVVVDAEA